MNNEHSQRFNRQNLDYLLTDLLPYEKGNHFTHRFLYEYLHKNKKKLNKIIRGVGVEAKYFNHSWHSAPLKFKVRKKSGGFREISLINPLGLLQSLVFIDLFENDIINITHNKVDFSARKARRTNSLTYKKNNKQTVYYTDKTKKQLLITLESSGTYFKHYPFKTITQLLNDISFTYHRDKFKVLNVVDIQDCFPSIYTHSFKWLISNKIYDSKKLSNSNSVYTNIDQFLQNINGSKTNGIIVGPEISRLLAEFLFVHLDQKLGRNLRREGLIEDYNYKIFRFVDDYYIFANDKETQQLIKDELSNLINEFQLKINELKESHFERDDTLNLWMYQLSPVMDDLMTIFSPEPDPKEELIEIIYNEIINIEAIPDSYLEVASNIEKKSNPKKYLRKIKYKDIRNKLNIAIKASGESSLISSYILSTILKNIENNNDIEINMEANELVSFILLTYTKSASYASTQKVIRIFVMMFELYEDRKFIDEIIERNIERFRNDIFRNHPADWIDFLMFISNYNINISTSLIEEITELLIDNETPTHIAALCLMGESKFISSRRIVRKVNTLIKSKLESINWSDFFQDNLSWWVLIFFSYPKLSSKHKQEMNVRLRDIQAELDNQDNRSINNTKSLIIDFLLNEKQHFIEWDFSKDSYYKKYYYYTKDRTVFNPDINNQINTSR
ncbi:RNA-directed DNA polymerase [Halobacillus sp. B29]|uniref:RNA-directed DNA polymerase n=1 Tax=Halobacillus sp. B29 TaxID=3457432 RepID=UPI003FCD972B